MKKALITLILTTTTSLLFGYNPLVRNFSRDAYKGGSQTWDIVQDSGGNMYFANNSGVLEFDGINWTLRRLNNGSFARSLFYDPAEKQLYVGGTNELGVMSISNEGFRYHSLLDSLGISVPEIWEIRKNSKGQIEFDCQNSRYTILNSGIQQQDIRSRTTGYVFCTAENQDYFAEGTTGDGVYIHNKKTGAVQHLSTDNGLQNNTVLSMCFDSSGGLWLGLDKGIDYVLIAYPASRLFGNPDIFGTGYASAFFEGYLYLGTNIGLFRIKETLLPFGYTDAHFERINGINGQVWNLQTIDGKLFCSHDKGLYILSSNGSIRQHLQLPGCWKLEPLEEGAPTHLLGSSYERFFVLAKKGDRWHLSNLLPGFTEAGKSFFRDSDGSIWFGHHIKGLYRLSLQSDFSDVQKVDHFGEKDGFPSDSGNYPFIYRGSIVFSTLLGFYRYDDFAGKALATPELCTSFSEEELNTLGLFETPERTARVFSSGDVLAVEYVNSAGSRQLDRSTFQHLSERRPRGFGSIMTLDESSVLINSEDGFDVLDTKALSGSLNESNIPSVYIKSIHLVNDGSPLYASRGANTNAQIKLNYKQNSLAIEFTEPSFCSPDAVEYSCKLEGYDKSFSLFGPEHSRDYYKLPAGRYTFVVRAHNRQLAGRITSDSINIIISKAWFQTWWAIIVYICTLLLCLYCLFRFIRRYSNLRAQKIAAAKAEEMRKAQISKDLKIKADELAASTMNLQRKNELLQKISLRVDDAVESAKNGDPVEVRLTRLRKLSEMIRENITHDTDWQKFQNNFDLVYDDFLKRLAIQFRDLSVSDKRMCAYLRMGLSSKDIAPLLGMTVRSVEMTRYRLRRKLDLPREENLTDFLQKY